MRAGSRRRVGLVAGSLLVPGMLAARLFSTVIPPGAQQLHLVGSHAEVRLDPPTVCAGDVYFVIEGTGALFIQKSGASGEEGPSTDVELARLAQTGDHLHTSMQDLSVGIRRGRPQADAASRGVRAPALGGRGVRGR